MAIKLRGYWICFAIVACCASRASAVVLFQDNFNTNTSTNWTVNKAPTAVDPNKQTAQFAFDYSSFGIPPAPGSSDTLGLRLRANLPLDGGGNEVTTRPAGTLSGLSVSPTGQNFGTSYQVTFYAWSNFFGAPNASGLADNTNSQGGTNNVLFAVGTSGTVPLVVGNTGAVTNSTIDGAAFATTGDGGIANDYRAYPATNAIGPTTLLAANAYANTNAFYTAKFPAVSAPAVQQSLATLELDEGTGFNPLAGSTQAGSFGFAWHKVVITKNNNAVNWFVDDTLFATVDTSALILGGSNIALGVSDVNSTTAAHPSLAFTIFDDLVVSGTAPAGVSGDYNGNGVVDAADYVLYRNGGPLQNEVNSIGSVDTSDYDAWRARFGNTSGAGSLESGSVPEPSSLLLIGTAGCYCWPVRRRS